MILNGKLTAKGFPLGKRVDFHTCGYVFRRFFLPKDPIFRQKFAVSEIDVMGEKGQAVSGSPSQLRRLHGEEIQIKPIEVSNHMSNEKKGTWLFRGFVGDEILLSYVGIVI